jgi:hypothetical protein
MLEWSVSHKNFNHILNLNVVTENTNLVIFCMVHWSVNKKWALLHCVHTIRVTFVILETLLRPSPSYTNCPSSRCATPLYLVCSDIAILVGRTDFLTYFILVARKHMFQVNYGVNWARQFVTYWLCFCLKEPLTWAALASQHIENCVLSQQQL